MKPIHKFNNGQGATLCHKCSCIISLGHTDDLYCKECKQKQNKKLYSEEEVYIILEKFRNLPLIQFQEWFEQFKNK